MITIPKVKRLRLQRGFFDLRLSVVAITIVDPGDKRIDHVAGDLCNCINGIIGRQISIRQAGEPEEGTIHLAVLDRDSNAESYSLAITPGGVIISGAGPIGLFWGMQTLMQIVRTTGDRLQCLRIDDSPDFPCRGFYHDVTRGKVPSLETLKSLVVKLAGYKVNQLQLYIEHTFAFQNIPEFRLGSDPLTAQEIRELDAWCRLYCIDLVPSLATFGHLYELLRIKRFEHLNELDIKASELPHNLWDRMAHYTIDVSSEEGFALIKSMLDEFLPLFDSAFCNICCDETFDLGTGKNRARAAEVGKGRLYIDYVKKLIGVVRYHGKSPMLWGDFVLHHPELIAELPRDTVFLNWNYQAGATGEGVMIFATRGVRQYVCPGTAGWSRFANDIAAASVNIRAMVRHGRKYRAIGVLTTDWGDCGHVNLLANSFHGMALGAALSWNAGSFRKDDDFDEAFSFVELGDQSGRIAQLLRELGSLCFYHFGNMYAWVNNCEGLWNREADVKEADGVDLARRHGCAVKILESLEQYIANPGPLCKRRDLDELIWGARGIVWTIELLAFKKRTEFGQGQDACPAIYGSSNQFLRNGELLIRSFEVLWRKRNKESELRNVAGTFEKIFEKIRQLG